MAKSTEIKLFRVKLKTAGKTPDQILSAYDGPKPNEEEVKNLIKAYDSLDGIEVVVSKSLISDGYCLAAWQNKDENLIRDFVYQAEQDEFFGSYVDDREEFIKDWESDDYSPPGSMVFENDDVEIIEELSGDGK